MGTMSPSPIANRSFLHDRKAAFITDKVVYATLDSLALKRTRLPLQLLPTLQNDDIEEKIDKSIIDREVSCEENSDIVKPKAANRQKNYSKCTAISSATRESYQTTTRSDKTIVSSTHDKRIIHDDRKVKDDENKSQIEHPECPVQNLTNHLTSSSTEDKTIKHNIANNVNTNPTSTDSNSPLVNTQKEKRTSSSNEENENGIVFSVDSSSSDDYEKINIAGETRVEENQRKETIPTFAKETSTISVVEPSQRKKISKKSKSTNCLTSRDATAVVEDRSRDVSKSVRLENESSSSDEGNDIVVRKKRHFTKNVFHYVPGHLGKRSKTLLLKKKKYHLSSSLSSLKSFQKESSFNEDTSGSNNFSKKDELKYVTISSPTNFVHVASATNPKLVSTENSVRASLEQIVITHEEKCATLPLLVGRNTQQNAGGEDRIETSYTNTVVGPPLKKEEMENDLSMTLGKHDKTAYVEIQTKSGRDLQLKSAKVPVETGQEVKTHLESKHASDSLRSAPRPNLSFLWGNQARNFISNESNEGLLDEDYDDVGPSNLLIEECDYDDVGPSSSQNEKSLAYMSTVINSEEIYDDVVTPNCNGNVSPVIHSNLEEINRSPNTEIDTTGVEYRRKSQKVEKTEEQENSMSDNENQYLSINNDYSSVDEDVNGGQKTAEDDVYDDVGLPLSEERVNSLYAAFTPVSAVGLVSSNGKESEWEDLEDSSTVLPCPCRKSDLCNKYVETQNIASKKKSWHRRSRKTKRQRSEGSRRSSRSFVKETQDSAVYDGGTDDSNYETLYSNQDDFSTDSEAETTVQSNQVDEETQSRINNIYLEAPTKPTPPPPREASLTQTLGRKIKMLRRTWSITKGNLGRIRRRTLADEDHNFENGKTCNNDHHVLDNPKYFSFRKHFRKHTSALSTFYLNDTTNDDCASTRNNNNNSTSKDVIYGNIGYNGASPVTNCATDPESQTRNANELYSVFADQEPLYQFYAAAVARIAFDSDSDGYEEVDVTNLPTTATDLVRPGHRTLWCQTPQVIHSGLLQRLTAEERKIQEAKFEILTSEASYLNSLRVLDNEFIKNYELSDEILTPVEREKLFGGVSSVLRASERFLSELETVWRGDPMLVDLPNVLLRYAENCSDIYVSYCSNQVSIDTTLKELRAKKGAKFLEVVSRIEMHPACRNLSLHSFLMLPMQRVTRLPLLADAVLSKLSMEHADRMPWERVLSSLSYVVAECNEGARTAAQEAEMEVLARKLEYSSKIKPVVLRGRYLVRSGPLIQLSTKADTEYKLTFGKRFNKTSLYLLLLTDYLLVTKLKSNTHEETYTVIDTCKRSFITLEPVSEESPFSGRNAMILTLLENHSGRQAEYVLTCDSNTERERWLEAVSPPNSGLVGETLYETWDCPQVMALYSYSPYQPDELSLQPGDVINVLRKMADGWYHGEKLLDGQQGWFPGNYTKEVASEHVRARNLKQRHRLLAITGSILQRRAKQKHAIQ